MGHVQINILVYPTILNIIPNEVPIDENGVLGSEFFRENKVNINYVSKYLEIQNKLYLFVSTQILIIPARTITTCYIPIENTEKKRRLHTATIYWRGNLCRRRNCKKLQG